MNESVLLLAARIVTALEIVVIGLYLPVHAIGLALLWSLGRLDTLKVWLGADLEKEARSYVEPR